jgi:hypothetical protein
MMSSLVVVIVSYSRGAPHASAQGQPPIQLPQYTQAESVSGTVNAVEIRALKPRPATAMAKV